MEPRAPTLLDGGDMFLGLDADWVAGGLWWQEAHTTTIRKLASAHVRALTKLGGDVVAFTGSDVMSPFAGGAAGAMLKLTRGEDGWTVGGSTDLGGVPVVVVVDLDGSLLALVRHESHGALVRIRDAQSVTVLHEFTFEIWEGASLARADDGKLYIGTGGSSAIVMLTPVDGGYEERRLIPDVCIQGESPYDPCSCDRPR
jgi:hypothetical protein